MSWIKTDEALPDDDQDVIATLINTNPENYHSHIKGVPFVSPVIYCYGKWYWWSNYIDAYGEFIDFLLYPIDESIKVVAWMPKPKPYEWIGKVVEEEGGKHDA